MVWMAAHQAEVPKTALLRHEKQNGIVIFSLMGGHNWLANLLLD